MRDYSAMTILINQKLQSAGTMDYSVAEVDYQIEESLKEYSTYRPHLVDVILEVEGRYGTDETGAATTDTLTDTNKGQFLAADATNEKIVHNITDNTRAVVLTQTSTSVVTLNSDIMDSGEFYKMYNRRCWNQKQVYIGDVPEYINIHSVEFPIGERRNWKLYDRTLEIDTAIIPDTNSNTAKITSLPNDEALVRFNMPHQLTQLTDWDGVLTASALVGATTLAGSTLQAAGTLEVGTEFNIENMRRTYMVTGTAAIATTVAVTFYPPIEATADSTWAINFRKSSLEPSDEEMFADLVASRIAINKSPLYFNAISLGGGVVYQNYLTWGERRLSETLGKLTRTTKPKTSQRYPIV